MTTSYWEEISDELLNNTEALKLEIASKFSQYFRGLPNHHLASTLHVEEDWTACQLADLEPKSMPRVIIFRPRRGEEYLGCVRVTNRESRLLLWDVFNTYVRRATHVYIGIIRPKCNCSLQNVEIKCQGLDLGSEWSLYRA